MLLHIEDKGIIMAIKIKWSSLLRLTDLEFSPEAPKFLTITDELVQAISWLTAATRHDRKLLRCDENGALLISDAWNGFTSVEAVEREPEANQPAPYTITVEHKGILVGTSDLLVKLSFTRIGSSVAEHTFLPPASFYWFPYPCSSVIVTLVPADLADVCMVGLVAYN